MAAFMQQHHGQPRQRKQVRPLARKPLINILGSPQKPRTTKKQPQGMKVIKYTYWPGESEKHSEAADKGWLTRYRNKDPLGWGWHKIAEKNNYIDFVWRLIDETGGMTEIKIFEPDTIFSSYKNNNYTVRHDYYREWNGEYKIKRYEDKKFKTKEEALAYVETLKKEIPIKIILGVE